MLNGKITISCRTRPGQYRFLVFFPLRLIAATIDRSHELSAVPVCKVQTASCPGVNTDSRRGQHVEVRKPETCFQVTLAKLHQSLEQILGSMGIVRTVASSMS